MVCQCLLSPIDVMAYLIWSVQSICIRSHGTCQYSDIHVCNKLGVGELQCQRMRVDPPIDNLQAFPMRQS